MAVSDVTRVTMVTWGGCVGGGWSGRGGGGGAQLLQCRCGARAGGMAGPAGLPLLPLLLLLLAVRPGRPAALYPASLQLQLPQLYSQLDNVLDTMVSGGRPPYGAAPTHHRQVSQVLAGRPAGCVGWHGLLVG